MKIEGYEEITQKEYSELPKGEGLYIYNCETGKIIYFKKIQEFPIVFEDKSRKIEIDEYGIEIINKKSAELLYFGKTYSEPLLIKALEKLKEVRK